MNQGTIHSRAGKTYDLPIFYPVFHPILSPPLIDLKDPAFGVSACIMNAYFLYKDRKTKKLLTTEQDLHDYIDFPGLVMTDSGAFQGFRGNLYLKNKDIVKFQERIGSDIVSVLDLVSPPWDKRSVAEKKWNRTFLRTEEATKLVSKATLAGPQQGGRFLDLRKKSTEDLLSLGIEYLALGSLVPFFNQNHDLEFVCRVIRDARAMAGPTMPIHVYGGGDPSEIPFMAAMGATIFDSSSYAHYAQGGWYMTPYGALKEDEPRIKEHFDCPCPFCNDEKSDRSDVSRLSCHNLWVIMHVMKNISAALKQDRLNAMLENLLSVHAVLFPESALVQSWHNLHEAPKGK